MTRWLWGAVAAAAVAAGCDLAPGGGTLADDGQPPATATPTPTPVTTLEFPCDVRAMMETYCAPCHSGNMYINLFRTREELLSQYGAGTLGQYAAMMVMTDKMPPSNAQVFPTDEERAILIDWVAAGMPPGPCGALTPPPPPAP